MGRRVSSGVVGGTGLGSLSVVSAVISSTVTDGDITLEPNGTGSVLVEADLFLHDQGDVQFGDADSSNYVAIQAPATVSSDYTLTLPAAVAGTNGFALVSDTGGNLSWSPAGAALTDNNSDSGTNYIPFTTQTQSDGFLTAARVATATRVLSYQPSTGILSTPEITVNGPARFLVTENIQTGNYTLALTDQGRAVTMNNTATVTVTVPPNSSVAFAIGSIVYISRVNTGRVTLAAGSGVTLSTVGDLGDGEEIAIRKRATDEWSVLEERKFSRTGSGGTTANQTVAISHSYTATGASTFVVS